MQPLELIQRTSAASPQLLGLAELQARFARALFDEAGPLPAGIGGSPEAAASRFQVYRSNVLSSLVRTLEARFPAVARLVGAEFFRAMAAVFIERAPPSSPALIGYGAAFADFLEHFPPVAELPYLPGVARIEWLRSQAYHASDAPHAGAQELAAAASCDPQHLYVQLHPSVGLVRSAYPVVSIWQTNANDAEVREIGPGHAAENALIVRHGFELLTMAVGDGALAFVSALHGGAPFAAAAEKAFTASSAFAPAEELVRLLSCGAITAFHQSPQLLNPDA